MAECTRRDFLMGAGAGAAAVAATGAAHATRALASEVVALRTQDDVNAIAWNYETDVVVCGFGAAGGYAACAAHDAGADVLLLEKATEDEAGGETSCFYGLIWDENIDFHNYYWVNDMPDADSWQEFFDTYYTGDYSFTGYFKAHGIELQDVGFDYLPGAGETWYATVKQDVTDRGIEVLYETDAKKLIQGPAGEIIGVVAYQGDTEVYFKARKGVCLACGDYSWDDDLVSQYHMLGVKMPHLANPTNTGDALKMGLSVGAKLRGIYGGLEFFAPSYRLASEANGDFAILSATSSIQTYIAGIEDTTLPSYIWVNRDGERFMNEELDWTHNKSQIPAFNMKEMNGAFSSGGSGASLEVSSSMNWAYPNLPFWAIFDQARMESGPLSVLAYDEYSLGWAGARHLYKWSMDNSEELEAGWIVEADSIEELCELCTGTDPWGNEVMIDPDGLIDQIDRWNEMCEAGDDEDFGRSNMQPISTDGPFYAVELAITNLYPCGALAVNGRMEVLDWNGQPIPRLYASGAAARVATLSPCHLLPGGGVAMGDQAAKLESWEV